jgi:hypothetical protein
VPAAPVLLALEDGQAVVVRAQAADEQRVAVQHHVLRRHRGAHAPRGRAAHELHRLARRDVLQHNAQRRHAGDERREDVSQEAGLTIKDVHVSARHLAVHQQRQPSGGHGLQRRLHLRGGGVGAVWQRERVHAQIGCASAVCV